MFMVLDVQLYILCIRFFILKKFKRFYVLAFSFYYFLENFLCLVFMFLKRLAFSCSSTELIKSFNEFFFDSINFSNIFFSFFILFDILYFYSDHNFFFLIFSSSGRSLEYSHNLSCSFHLNFISLNKKYFFIVWEMNKISVLKRVKIKINIHEQIFESLITYYIYL